MRLLPLPGTFKPRSDSLMLAAQVRRQPLPNRAAALDLCTGSGLLAVTAAQCGAARVVAVDVSRRAIASVRIAARLNGVRIDARRGDLFDAVRGERFDLIVSNPPYLLSADDRLPTAGAARAWEAGRSGRVFVDRICSEASAHLKPGGVLLLLHSSFCDEQRTLQLLAAHGLEASVLCRQEGPLGPLMRERVELLRQDGHPVDREEIIIFRARRPGHARATGESRAAAAAT